MPVFDKLKLVQGDITKEDVDAIVNAANRGAPTEESRFMERERAQELSPTGSQREHRPDHHGQRVVDAGRGGQHTEGGRDVPQRWIHRSAEIEQQASAGALRTVAAVTVQTKAEARLPEIAEAVRALLGQETPRDAVAGRKLEDWAEKDVASGAEGKGQRRM